MTTNTVEVGHVLVSHTGIILRADAGFCAIMRSTPTMLVGRGLLSITAPQDRAVCADYMKTLRRSRQPFRVAKRMLRDDGSTVWVDKTVAIADFGDDSDGSPPLIVATVVPIQSPERLEDPARLLGMALFLRESRRVQALMFTEVGAGDLAWGIILSAYIAEATGQTLCEAEISRELRAVRSVTLRWLRALRNDGLVEPEGDDVHFRLTALAYARVEAYLANRILKAPADHCSGRDAYPR